MPALVVIMFSLLSMRIPRLRTFLVKRIPLFCKVLCCRLFLVNCIQYFRVGRTVFQSSRKPSSCHWSDLHVPGILLFCLLLFSHVQPTLAPSFVICVYRQCFPFNSKFFTSLRALVCIVFIKRFYSIFHVYSYLHGL